MGFVGRDGKVYTSVDEIFDDQGNAYFPSSFFARGPRPWVDVMAYGAKGDGFTDDSAAIQAAINTASAAVGSGPSSIVYLPMGNYLLKSPLVIAAESVSFIGAGFGSAANAFHQSFGTRLIADATFPASNFILSVGPTANEGEPIGYANIEGFIVDGAGVANVDGIRWTAHTSTANKVRVERCRDGWTFKGATNSPSWNLYDNNIERIYSFNNTRDGYVFADGNATDMYFLHIVAGTNGQDGLHLLGGSGNTFLGGHFYGSTRNNGHSENGGGSQSRWVGTRFDNCGQDGFLVDVTGGNFFMPQFEGCTFVRAGTSANNTYDCFHITRSSGSFSSQRGLIKGCHIWTTAANKPRYGINFEGGYAADWNYDVEIDANMQTAPINDGGSRNAGFASTNNNGVILNLPGDTRRPFQFPSEATLVSGVNANGGECIQVTLTAARLVGAPLNPIIGQRLTFLFIQNGTGGWAVTWNAAFVTAWSDTGNTANKRSSIEFEYNGSKWNQIGAQSPYI